MDAFNIKAHLNFLPIRLLVLAWLCLLTLGEGFASNSDNYQSSKLEGGGVFYDLETALEDATSAEVLILSRQSLEEIPSDIDRLVNLKKLDVSNNSISVLPSSITRLEKLEELILSDNSFKTVPSEVAMIKTLHTVKLDGNEIQDLSGLSSYSGSNLKKVTLHRNNIASISASDLEKLSKVKYLSLYGNPMKGIPDAICGFDSLNVLIIPNDVMFSTPTCLKNFKEITPTYQVWSREHAFKYMQFVSGMGPDNEEKSEEEKQMDYMAANHLRLAGNGHYTYDVKYPIGFRPANLITYVSLGLFFPINIPRLLISKKYSNRFVYTELMKLDQKIDRETMSTPLNDSKLKRYEDKKRKWVKRLK